MAKSTRQFQDVVCDQKKPNGHVCRSYLGSIETSRPNVARHRCKICKLVYTHETDTLGVVERVSVTKYIPDSETSPVSVA
jgi:hypothetical protein